MERLTALSAETGFETISDQANAQPKLLRLRIRFLHDHCPIDLVRPGEPEGVLGVFASLHSAALRDLSQLQMPFSSIVGLNRHRR
jgi:hypothetical protein